MTCSDNYKTCWHKPLRKRMKISSTTRNTQAWSLKSSLINKKSHLKLEYFTCQTSHHGPQNPAPHRTVPYPTGQYRTHRLAPPRTVPYHTLLYRTVPYRTLSYPTLPNPAQPNPTPTPTLPLPLPYYKHNLPYKVDSSPETFPILIDHIELITPALSFCPAVSHNMEEPYQA